VNADGKGQMSDGDTELLYDRPISTYFNVQAGVRSDFDSMPSPDLGGSRHPGPCRGQLECGAHQPRQYRASICGENESSFRCEWRRISAS